MISDLAYLKTAPSGAPQAQARTQAQRTPEPVFGTALVDSGSTRLHRIRRQPQSPGRRRPLHARRHSKTAGSLLFACLVVRGNKNMELCSQPKKFQHRQRSWRLAWLCVFAVDSARIVRSATAAACLAPIVRSERCPLPASQRSTYRISWTARTWTRSLRSLTQFSDGTKRPGSTCQLIMRHLKRSKAVDDRPSHPRQHVPRRHKIPHEPSGGRAEPRERPSAAHRPSSLLPSVPAW